MTESLAGKRICVTGGAGFLGRRVCAELGKCGADDPFVPRSSEFDLTQPGDVVRVFEQARPDVIIHLAAEVGGIGANRASPGRFFYANMAMGLNLIEEARRRGVEKFVQVGTVCAYPEDCEVPFREESLWDGFPEETNAPYGVAKRALGVMLAGYKQQYGLNGVCLLPVNLYGPGDSFDPKTSHVIPALIRKFCDAVDAAARSEAGSTSVTLWGSGEVSREFLYVDDAAKAIVLATAMLDDPQPINLGTGCEITIADLAAQVARICGYTGEIVWDATQPSGQPRRRLDTSKAASLLSWRAETDFEIGLRTTIEWWRSQRRQMSGVVS